VRIPIENQNSAEIHKEIDDKNHNRSKVGMKVPFGEARCFPVRRGSLTDGHFTYLGTCDENGKRELPTHAVNQYLIDRDIDAELLTREQKLEKETEVLKIGIEQHLHLRIQRWVGKSCFLFMSGLYLNLVWIIILFSISRTIANKSFNVALSGSQSTVPSKLLKSNLC
jgi:hypothetical protein